MTKHEAIKNEPGTPHPLAENYFALFLTIVKNFSIDDALIAMRIGSHSDTATEVITSAIERERGARKPTGPRRPPKYARLARLYS